MPGNAFLASEASSPRGLDPHPAAQQSFPMHLPVLLLRNRGLPFIRWLAPTAARLALQRLGKAVTVKQSIGVPGSQRGMRAQQRWEKGSPMKGGNMSRKLFAAVTTLAAVVTLAFAAVATATSSATAQQAPQQSPTTAGTTTQVGAVAVQLQVKRFVKRGGRLFAVGTAVGSFNPTGASPQFNMTGTDRRAFVVRVHKLRRLTSAQRICPVLDLRLGPLDLNLLGLMVHLDQVHLTITADSNGGLLGSLLCSLSGRSPLGLQAAKLTRAAKRSGLATKGVSVTAPIYQASGSGGGSGLTATPGAIRPMAICTVLELTLGPLDLNLLGLMVHLSGAGPNDPVHLLITANSEGGILGSLLCPGIAGGAPSG